MSTGIQQQTTRNICQPLYACLLLVIVVIVVVEDMPKGKYTRHKKHGRGLFFSNIQLLLHIIIIPIYIPNWWSLVAGGILVSSLKTLQPTVLAALFTPTKKWKRGSK